MKCRKFRKRSLNWAYPSQEYGGESRKGETVKMDFILEGEIDEEKVGVPNS